MPISLLLTHYHRFIVHSSIKNLTNQFPQWPEIFFNAVILNLSLFSYLLSNCNKMSTPPHPHPLLHKSWGPGDGIKALILMQGESTGSPWTMYGEVIAYDGHINTLGYIT